MRITYINGGYSESFDLSDFPAEITEVTIDVTNPNNATWGFEAEYKCPKIPVLECGKIKVGKKR